MDYIVKVGFFADLAFAAHSKSTKIASFYKYIFLRFTIASECLIDSRRCKWRTLIFRNKPQLLLKFVQEMWPKELLDLVRS